MGQDRLCWPTGRPVLFVPGNHEYYGCCYEEYREKMREAAAGSNVVLLDRDRCEIDGVVFLGATPRVDFNLLGSQPPAMLKRYTHLRAEDLAVKLG